MAAYVNSAGASWFGGSGTSEGATLNGVTAGNLLVVCIANANGQAVTGISGNSNTYTSAGTPKTDATCTLTTYYVTSANSGNTTVTVTWASDPSFGAIRIHEYSATDTSAPLDKYATNAQFNPGTSANAITSTSVTTTTDGQVIFGATFDAGGNGGTETAGTGFTGRGSSGEMTSEDQIQSAAGAVAATFTSNINFTNPYTVVVTFKAVAAAGHPTMRRWGGTPFVGGQGIGQKVSAGSSGRAWGRYRSGVFVPSRAQEAA